MVSTLPDNELVAPWFCYVTKYAMSMPPTCAIISRHVTGGMARRANNKLIFLSRVQPQMRGASLLTAVMCIYIPVHWQFTVLPINSSIVKGVSAIYKLCMSSNEIFYGISLSPTNRGPCPKACLDDSSYPLQLLASTCCPLSQGKTHHLGPCHNVLYQGPSHCPRARLIIQDPVIVSCCKA